MKPLKVLITAGPTHEKIDPVRFIGNYSSGKMGFALAEECANRGMEVTLVAGPVSIKHQHPNITRVNVVSALEMYHACQELFPCQDIAIMCAAVADYRPADFSDTKIKRNGDDLTIRLVPNPDIAASLGAVATEKQVLIGFALETNDELVHAQQKMAKKNLDMIVLNSLRDNGAGFQVDTNKVTLLMREGASVDIPLKLKTEVAADIIAAAEEIQHQKSI